MITTRIRSLTDLQAMKNHLQSQDEVTGLKQKSTVVKVGMGTSGIASGAKDVMAYFSLELAKRGIVAVVKQTGDMGYCYAEPTIEVQCPGEAPIIFGYVNIRKADEIIEKYIKYGELVEGIIPVNYETIDE